MFENITLKCILYNKSIMHYRITIIFGYNLKVRKYSKSLKKYENSIRKLFIFIIVTLHLSKE